MSPRDRESESVTREQLSENQRVIGRRSIVMLNKWSVKEIVIYRHIRDEGV